MSLRRLTACLVASALLMPATLLAADTPATDTPVAEEKVKAKPVCEPLTGTRVRLKAGRECPASASPFRRFSEEEIERTGEINIADALRKLDPAFR